MMIFFFFSTLTLLLLDFLLHNDCYSYVILSIYILFEIHLCSYVILILYRRFFKVFCLVSYGLVLGILFAISSIVIFLNLTNLGMEQADQSYFHLFKSHTTEKIASIDFEFESNNYFSFTLVPGINL